MGDEFYGKYRHVSFRNTLFPALRRFKLISMDNLVESMDALEPTTAVVFPCLEKLSIRDCVRLIHASCYFPSLKELRISNISHMSFEKIGSKLTTLTSLCISKVFKLTFLAEQLLQNNTGLLSLQIEMCPELLSILPHQDVLAFCTSLRSLKIEECERLSYLLDLHNLCSIEELEVLSGSNLRYFPSIVGAISHLRLLRISCGVEVLPTWLQSCTSLSILRIKHCPNLVSIPDLQELRSLIKLQIRYCGRLKHLPKGLDCLTRLEDLSIGGFCEELDASPSLNILHLHTALEWLSLYECENINLPGEIQCFTALRELCIKEFDGMTALPEWLGNLSSLQKLSLRKCKNLMHLPQAMQRLTKLEMLDIRYCPKLSERCVKESGAEWFKISHIPNIKLVV